MTVKTDFGTYENCGIFIDHYVLDHSLALQIRNKADGQIAIITRCFPFSGLEEGEAFVDTNNCPWAEDFIREYQLGEPTGTTCESGFCVYPLYKFDLERLKEFELK